MSWGLHTITLREDGSTSTTTQLGGYASRYLAMRGAYEYAKALAGYSTGDYRAPEIAQVTHDVYGDCFKVGNANVDPSYTLIYPEEQ